MVLPTDEESPVNVFFHKWKVIAAASILVANFLFVGLAIYWNWPYWWVNVNYERSAITWFSSLQLAACGLLSYLIFKLNSLTAKEERSWKNLAWPLLGVGFFYLSLDERFQFHELIRDQILVPNSIGINVSGFDPGNIVILFYSIVGIGLGYAICSTLKFLRPLLFWVYLAIAIAIPSVVYDAREPSRTDSMQARKTQFIKCTTKIGTEMCFLVFFTLYGLEHLQYAIKKRQT